MHEKLRMLAAQANRALADRGLDVLGQGCVSLCDHTAGVIVMKPDGMRPADAAADRMLVALPDRRILWGTGKLPPDFAVHAAIYKYLPSIDAAAFTYGEYSTAFAQAGRPIRPNGTLHARCFGGAIPCTRQMTPSEIAGDYGDALGAIIAETMNAGSALLKEVGCVLVHDGGLLAFGDTAMEAVGRLEMAETVARHAYRTELLQKSGTAGGLRMQEDLLRHIYEVRHS